MGSGCGSRPGLAHKRVVAIGKGWDSVAVVANGLWILFSLGLGAQKRRRDRGWLERPGFCFGGRQWALDFALVRVWCTNVSSL